MGANIVNAFYVYCGMLLCANCAALACDWDEMEEYDGRGADLGVLDIESPDEFGTYEGPPAWHDDGCCSNCGAACEYHNCDLDGYDDLRATGGHNALNDM